MNAVRVVAQSEVGADSMDRIETMLRKSLASTQGLTVTIEQVGKRVYHEELVLNGELLSVNTIKRGTCDFITFEVRHPGGTGGIRKTYRAANAGTMKSFMEWERSTSDQQLERLITSGKTIKPGLKLDRLHG